MATPRSQLVDQQIALHYHLVSRCVRRSWLCGRDPHTRKNYNHRKTWLESRLFHLGQYFAIEVDAFAIMSNHFHLVVFYDPLACESWTDEEVIWRWCEAFPRPGVLNDPDEVEHRKARQREALLQEPGSIEAARRCLGSLSAFMKNLKQPIARRANREDKCTGHFFEGRFYSGALLGEEAVIAAMVYVDLNPVRAKIAKNIEQCRDCSIRRRLDVVENSPERLKEAIAPLVSGLGESGAINNHINMSLGGYIEHLRWLSPAQPPANPDDNHARWFARVAAIKKRQRAYEFIDDLKDWVERHGYKRPVDALPE
jgi:hypothetical protein